MPRLRNSLTGVVVNVSDETAEGLSAEWVPADAAPAEEKPKRAPRKSSKSE